MIKKIKPYMMPIAILIGALFYSFFSQFHAFTPYLIFVMLFFTYCGISIKDIRFSPLHVGMLLVQALGSIGLFLLLKNINLALAQAGLISFLAPTATSAVVIGVMLKGNAAGLTAYTLLSNFLVVLLAPLLFSFWGTNAHIDFWNSFFQITQRVFILLLGPLFLATLLRKFLPSVAKIVAKNSIISFYLWVVSLSIVSSMTVQFVLMMGRDHLWLEIAIAVVSLFACLSQYLIGHRLGIRYGDCVVGRQGLGHKNTILAIWLAHTYLNPLSSIAPGAYIFWQNIVNSWQVWKNRRNL